MNISRNHHCRASPLLAPPPPLHLTLFPPFASFPVEVKTSPIQWGPGVWALPALRGEPGVGRREGSFLGSRIGVGPGLCGGSQALTPGSRLPALTRVKRANDPSESQRNSNHKEKMGNKTKKKKINKETVTTKFLIIFLSGERASRAGQVVLSGRRSSDGRPRLLSAFLPP